MVEMHVWFALLHPLIKSNPHPQPGDGRRHSHSPSPTTDSLCCGQTLRSRHEEQQAEVVSKHDATISCPLSEGESECLLWHESRLPACHETDIGVSHAAESSHFDLAVKA
jgi:hypothetical protein